MLSLSAFLSASGWFLFYNPFVFWRIFSLAYTLMTAIADISVKTVSPERLGRISNHLEDWDNASFEDRRLVLDGLVSKITATSEFVQIDWKI